MNFKNNEHKFEIRIVKTKYENQLLSHLWKPPYMRIDLLVFFNMAPWLVIISLKNGYHKSNFFF
jgi:hypothetical protein